MLGKYRLSMSLSIASGNMVTPGSNFDVHTYPDKCVIVQYYKDRHVAKAVKLIKRQCRKNWHFNKAKLSPYQCLDDKKILIINFTQDLDDLLYHLYNTCIACGSIVRMGYKKNFLKQKSLLIRKRPRVIRSKSPPYYLDAGSTTVVLHNVAVRLDCDSVFNLGKVSKVFNDVVIHCVHNPAFWKSKLEWLYKRALSNHKLNWMLAYNVFDVYSPNKGLQLYFTNYEMFLLAISLGADVHSITSHGATAPSEPQLCKSICKVTRDDNAKALKYLLEVYAAVYESITMKLLVYIIVSVILQDPVGDCECIKVAFEMYAAQHGAAGGDYANVFSEPQQLAILMLDKSYDHEHLHAHWSSNRYIVICYLIDTMKLDPSVCDNAFLSHLTSKTVYKYLIRRVLLDPRVSVKADNYKIVREADPDNLGIIFKLCNIDMAAIDLSSCFKSVADCINKQGDHDMANFMIFSKINCEVRVDLTKYIDRVPASMSNPHSSKEVCIDTLIQLDPFVKSHMTRLHLDSIKTIRHK